MRHELLGEYLQAVETTVSSLLDAHVELYTEEILASKRANLRIRIRFSNGQLLELNEAVTIESGSLCWLGYRYHCQDAENRLVFRYDNTPHFPDLTSFPHHKHEPDAVIEAKKPTIFQVIVECKKRMMPTDASTET